MGATYLSGAEAIQFIVKRVERSTPCGYPLLSHAAEGDSAPKTGGSGTQAIPATRKGSWHNACAYTSVVGTSCLDRCLWSGHPSDAVVRSKPVRLCRASDLSDLSDLSDSSDRG